MLKACNIEKAFAGTRVLFKVDFSVKKGEVHGLVGENGAGKSTLMNIIAGVCPQDAGDIFFDGAGVFFDHPGAARDAGVGLVHQEPNLCAHLTVAENIFIGRLPEKGVKMVDFGRLYAMADGILKELKAGLKPQDKVGSLSIAKQQIVEIARAISLNCSLLILDEPTSSLTEGEAGILFGIIKQLKEKGISIIYISHRLTEVLNICDRISVLRDGRLINTLEAKAASRESVVGMMVGKHLGFAYPQKNEEVGKELLRIEDFTSEKHFRDISFVLHSGEILGFAGLVGSGRTKLMRAICGIDGRNSGRIYLNGKDIKVRSYSQAIKLGIGYLTEDRKSQGLFFNMDLPSNITAASLHKMKKGIMMDTMREEELSRKYMEALNIKVKDVKQAVANLSGGNQQKIMIARLLSVNPGVIILDEPTRGIDVGAKAEIHKLVRRLAGEGAGVIMVSSDLPEVVGMCDRVIVMHEGSITGVIEKNHLDEQKIMWYASGKIA